MQDVVQNAVDRSDPEPSAEVADLSSHLAVMAVVVGLIIAWVGFCGI